MEGRSTNVQTVFGEGPEDARIVLVGEQPGDEEDRAGRPFIGPAGQLLDAALAAAGLDRSALYLTNAVKHFRHETVDGKPRIHKKADSRQVAACRPWLNAELARIKPQILICMGVTAAQSVLGRAVRLHEERGRRHATGSCARTFVTTHPAAILRAQEGEKQAALARFVDELRFAAADSGACMGPKSLSPFQVPR